MKQVERVIVLNCIERTDRMANIASELSIVGMEFERFEAVRFKEGNGFLNSSVRSNWVSHEEMLRLAEADTRLTMIFEDDAKFIDHEKFLDYREQIRTFQDWDVVYFYGSRIGKLERLQKIACTHAYIVNPSSAKLFREGLQRGREIIEEGKTQDKLDTLIDHYCGYTLQNELRFYGTPYIVIQDRAKWGSDLSWGFNGDLKAN